MGAAMSKQDQLYALTRRVIAKSGEDILHATDAFVDWITDHAPELGDEARALSELERSGAAASLVRQPVDGPEDRALLHEIAARLTVPLSAVATAAVVARWMAAAPSRAQADAVPAASPDKSRPGGIPIWLKTLIVIGVLLAGLFVLIWAISGDRVAAPAYPFLAAPGAPARGLEPVADPDNPSHVALGFRFGDPETPMTGYLSWPASGGGHAVGALSQPGVYPIGHTPALRVRGPMQEAMIEGRSARVLRPFITEIFEGHEQLCFAVFDAAGQQPMMCLLDPSCTSRRACGAIANKASMLSQTTPP